MPVLNISAKYFKLILYVLIVILINIVAKDLFFRIDLTANKVYSLSKVSKKVVSTLKEPLSIKVFFSQDLPAPHNITERYLKDLLREYAVHGKNNFNYQFYNLSSAKQGINPETEQNREIAENYGIRPVQIQAVEQDEINFKTAYMGLVIIHGDMLERIQAITSTDALEYKLTTAIQKLNNKISVLLNLKHKIKATLYFSPALKRVAPYMGLSRLADFPQSMQEVMQELNEKNYGTIDYQIKAPQKEQSISRLAEEFDIMHLKWPDLDQGAIKSGTGIIGLVLEYGNKQVDLPLLEAVNVPLLGTQYNLIAIKDLKDRISDSIDSLAGINQDLDYVADKGTLDLSGSRASRQQDGQASNFAALASKTYNLQPVNLAEQGVAQSSNCLLIPGPTQDFSDYELFQIDQALMRGTNLAVFVDAFIESSQQNQSMGFQSPVYKELNTNLEKLLAHYGLKIKKSFVLDKNCYQQRLGQQFGGGEQAIYYAPLIKNSNINHELDFMKNIKGLFALKVSPLRVDENKLAKKGIKAHALFSSSENSWEMQDNINLNPMFIQPPAADTKMEKKTLAYFLEGKFSSFFADKAIPQKQADDSKTAKQSNATQNAETEQNSARIKSQQKVLERSKRPGKILLISSSEMLKNSLLDSEGQSPNAIFIMNVLDALNGREDMALMRSKEQSFNPIYETDAGTRAVVKIFNIVGLPVLVVVFGLAALIRRHSRKKRIRMMFE